MYVYTYILEELLLIKCISLSVIRFHVTSLLKMYTFVGKLVVGLVISLKKMMGFSTKVQGSIGHRVFTLVTRLEIVTSN